MELKTVYRNATEREDDCNYCGGKRCIEIYTDRNKPINYSNILDKRDMGENIDISGIIVKSAKCTNCDTQYTIFWDNRKIPKPLYSQGLIEAFLQRK